MRWLTYACSCSQSWLPGHDSGIFTETSGPLLDSVSIETQKVQWQRSPVSGPANAGFSEGAGDRRSSTASQPASRRNRHASDPRAAEKGDEGGQRTAGGGQRTAASSASAPSPGSRLVSGRWCARLTYVAWLNGRWIEELPPPPSPRRHSTICSLADEPRKCTPCISIPH